MVLLNLYYLINTLFQLKYNQSFVMYRAVCLYLGVYNKVRIIHLVTETSAVHHDEMTDV